MISTILETFMIVSFGISWPFNLAKSIKTRSTKGKSILFLSFILVGYAAGILSKFLNPSFMNDIKSLWYVLFFYCLNFIMVGLDFMFYFINKSREKREAI